MRQKERDIKRKRDTERGIQIERLRQNTAASSKFIIVSFWSHIYFKCREREREREKKNSPKSIKIYIEKDRNKK